MGHLVQTIHLSCTNTNNISKRTETRFHITHVTYEFQCMHPKWLLSQWYIRFKLCTYLASRLALSLNEIPHDPRHLGVPSGASRRISEPMVRSVQTVHLSCVKITLSLNGPKDLPLDPRHLGVPSGAFKTISKPLVHYAQTIHLSCTNTNTVSKRTRIRFHMTHVT